jgi:DNA adenine methylase
MEPIFRWAGSKRQLLGKLHDRFANMGGKYLEPFCGSACLFFEIEPQSAVLGDLNADLIQAYRVVRSDPSLVIECLNRLPKGKRSYYQIRGLNPLSLSSGERAARFLYLNHYCFNGLYRTDLRGHFNVPFSHSQRQKPIKCETVFRSAAVLGNATLLHGDFEHTLDLATAGDFVYLDPPYVTTSRRVFGDYCKDSFGTKDLGRLVTCLNDLDRRGVNFVLSYAYLGEARRLFSKWNVVLVKTRRNIAGFAGARKQAVEILASNFE